MDFKDRIKEMRKRYNMSQQELAERVGVTYSAIGHWERGLREPNLVMLKKIASVLDVTTDYLLGLSDEMTYRKVWEKDGETFAILSTDNKNDPTQEERWAVETAETINVPLDRLSRLGVTEEDIRRIVREEIRRNGKG